MKETNDIYEGIPEYLEAFRRRRERHDKICDRYHQRAGYAADAVHRRAPAGFNRLVSDRRDLDEDVQRERDEVLSAGQGRTSGRLADIVREVLKTGALCAIGNEEKIKADAAMFGSIQPLYNGTASEDGQ